MRLRNGFVSNSSSSSFIIAGISLEEKELARRLGISVEDAEENEIEAGESLYDIIEDKLERMEIDYDYDYENGLFVIGEMLSDCIEGEASIRKEDVERGFKKAEEVLKEVIEAGEEITLLAGYREG